MKEEQLSHRLEFDELVNVPDGSIVINEFETVIALKLTPNKWSISGEQYTVTTEILYYHATKWYLIRRGFITHEINFDDVRNDQIGTVGD